MAGKRSEVSIFKTEHETPTIQVQTGPRFPLGRRVLLDGVDALDHEGYQSHCRSLAASVDARRRLLEWATGDQRHLMPNREYLRVDLFLNPAWLLELQLAGARLMRHRKSTAEYALGIRIRDAIRAARRVFRFGERGYGAREISPR